MCFSCLAGAKTAVTGGSVPRSCDRPVVVISTQRLKKILPFPDGQKVLCFAGAGIFSLQETLKERERDSHSVLGSIFLNPSVAAGVAFGSGGTQIHKGPAFTNRALYARIGAGGKMELVRWQNIFGLGPKTYIHLHKHISYSYNIIFICMTFTSIYLRHLRGDKSPFPPNTNCWGSCS